MVSSYSNSGGTHQIKYSLSLMDALFSDQEMANSCFSNIKSLKPCLPKEKLDLIEGTQIITLLSPFKYIYIILDCINEKFRKGTYRNNYLDASKRIKRGGEQPDKKNSQ